MRIYTGRRHYYYTNVDPYSLVIALPGRYGHNKLKYEQQREENCNWQLLKMSSNWKIHPEW